ncbi:MAG: hypothetical protein IKQ36_10510 [Clostridia bacterium]|nr:hypothetical protein [Clostridia bacterium]
MKNKLAEKKAFPSTRGEGFFLFVQLIEYRPELVAVYAPSVGAVTQGDGSSVLLSPRGEDLRNRICCHFPTSP